MPKHVDHEQRRREICRAALSLLAREGAAGLTFRSLAKELGGSLTLVTHYYASRDELLMDMPAQLTLDWQQELNELDADPDPRTRLRKLLAWLLPTDAAGLEEELARFALVVARHPQVPLDGLRSFDVYVRQLIREHVAPLVPDDQVEIAVDLLRALTDGITVDVLTNPEAWPAGRQLALLDVGFDRIIQP